MTLQQQPKAVAAATRVKLTAPSLRSKAVKQRSPLVLHMALLMSYPTSMEIKKTHTKNNIQVFGVVSPKIRWMVKPDVSKNFWVRFPSSGKSAVYATSTSKGTVSKAYIREYTHKNKTYRRLDSCLVIPPPGGKKPRAIIEFLGGAFVGAVPEVTYSHLMNLLAKEGFLVVSVPYNVTFNHSQAATEVYERFNVFMDMLLASGLPSDSIIPADLIHLPVYSVGHSNGALLQVLIGSYYDEKIPKANAIISFNNRPASEAVPYFEQFGPIVRQMMPFVEASPMYTMARSASGDAWKAMLEIAGPIIQTYNDEALASLTKFVDQLPSVMNQVTQGISEFTPTPSENRDFCKKTYNVQRTLLVKFSTDAIDETDLLESILKPRVESIGGTIEKINLSGNHLTPCVQDVTWQVGDIYTPADALAQGLKSLSLNDTRVLARIISDWFGDLNDP